MKILLKIIAIGVVVTGLLDPGNIQAGSAWVVERSHSEIVVTKDGQVEIVETVRVNYGSNEVSGFQRIIPLKYTIDKQVAFAQVEVTNVQRNDVDEPYRVEGDRGELRLLIGDD